MTDELDIPKLKILQAIDQIREKKKLPNTDSIYHFIVRNSATNMSKELIELVIRELFIQNVIFNKKKLFKVLIRFIN